MAVNRTSKDTKINPNLKPYFIFGCISILIIVIYLIANKDLSPDQQFFFKILFSLGCAGVAAVIPGIANLKYKGIISASGAIVVFILIINLNPPQKKFNITIFPKTAEGDLIDLSDAKLTIQLRQGFLEAVKTSENTFKFNDVPNDYYGDSLRFTLSSAIWVFENGRRNAVKMVKDESLDLHFMKDTAFLTIGGTLYYHNAPLVGALIEDYGNHAINTSTDANGVFMFHFPASETRARIRFAVRKNGTTFPPLDINMGNQAYETNFQ